MTQDWKTVKNQILKTANERRYSGMMRDTLDCFVELAKDKEAAAQEAALILAEETEERIVNRRLQPFLKKQDEEM